MVKSEPVTPLGRPKATKSLGGMVEPEPLPRLLIWHICHESFGDLADLNHCHSYWGPWSCPTMVIPSEQLSIAYFCKWFLSLPLLPCCFHGLFVLCFCWISFMSTSIFFPVQPMIFDPPLNPEESAWFTFSLLTSWSNQGARIKLVRFVRELLSPFLTVMVYKTTASGLAKASFMLKHGRYLCIIYLLYYWYTYQDHNPADGITATEVQIFLIAGNMN